MQSVYVQMAVWAGLAAMAALPLSGRAETAFGKQPGTELLQRCEPALWMVEARSRRLLTDAEYAQAQTCLAFVEGFLWGHGWAAWREHRDMYFCPPEEFTAAQFVPFLVQYLRAHPERLDAAAHVLLFSALSNAYPCQPAAGQSEGTK